MGLLDKIKNLFVPSAEEVRAAKDKMWQLMKQATKRDDLGGFEIVYGKFSETKETLTTRREQYYNYAIAFNGETGELVILPIDPKLASCGWPVFINEETLKSAKSSICLYEFDLKDGDCLLFDAPTQNYKIAKSLGAMELPIMQQREVKAFKEFFKAKFG